MTLELFCILLRKDSGRCQTSPLELAPQMSTFYQTSNFNESFDCKRKMTTKEITITCLHYKIMAITCLPMYSHSMLRPAKGESGNRLFAKRQGSKEAESLTLKSAATLMLPRKPFSSMSGNEPGKIGKIKATEGKTWVSWHKASSFHIMGKKKL